MCVGTLMCAYVCVCVCKQPVIVSISCALCVLIISVIIYCFAGGEASP